MAAPRGKSKDAPIIIRHKPTLSRIRRWNRRRFPDLSYNMTVASIVEQWEQIERKAGK